MKDSVRWFIATQKWGKANMGHTDGHTNKGKT